MFKSVGDFRIDNALILSVNIDWSGSSELDLILVSRNFVMLGIDEIGTMSFEDQEQFLSLMDKGYFDFKMGICQRLESETGFIVTSNPMTSDFRNSDRLSIDEIPLKGQLIDRLDLVFVFRKPQTLQKQKDFAYNMHQISRKHFNLTFYF
jgi:DNA replicative helicase MCM subunit Mcm2 (Cdc46/Mcm family)